MLSISSCVENEALLVGPKRLVHANRVSVLSEFVLMKFDCMLNDWSLTHVDLQCFETVGWVAGRAYDL